MTLAARGQHTWNEIESQPNTWASTLKTLSTREEELRQAWSALAARQVLFAGCGSTYYLSQSAAALFQAVTGTSALALPGSQLALFANQTVPDPRQTLLVAISRSGTTTETLMAVDSFRKLGGRGVWAITCDPSSTLAGAADLVLAAEPAQEKSVAQTRSFSSMLLLAQAVAAVVALDRAMLARLRRLPDRLRELVQRAGETPIRLGADLSIERLFFLGNGPLYGLACEAMLKAKEMSLSAAEAFHALEFRHGPMSMVDERTLVVGLLSDTAAAEEVRVLRDMAGLGARTLALVEHAGLLGSWQPDTAIELKSGVGQWERALLHLAMLQRLAYSRAMARGLDPDRPHNLTAVVTL